MTPSEVSIRPSASTRSAKQEMAWQRYYRQAGFIHLRPKHLILQTEMAPSRCT